MDSYIKAFAVKLLGYLKSFWALLKTDITELWEDNKIFVLVFGAIMLAIKFHTVLMNLIIAGEKSVFNSAQQQSNNLENQENQDNQQANQLQQQAQDLPNNQPPVGDDWFTKQ
jgi:hypothetical protein